MVGIGRKVNGLYLLEYLHLSSSPHPAASFSVTSDLWHHRLGHLSTSRLKTLSDFGVLGKFQFSSSNNFEGCRFAKQVDVPFGSNNYLASEIFDLVHSDIWGKAPISSLSGYNDYICFVDNCSRYTWVISCKIDLNYCKSNRIHKHD